MLLYHDQPSSSGVENALRRARQLALLSYTPVKPLPVVQKLLTKEGKSTYLENYSPAELPVQGVLYSSVRRYETYLGYNVTPETFLSAVANPNSVVYKKPITGTGQNVHCYYGIVCSSYVSYCMELPYRTNCARWPSLPGMHPVDTSALENLRLADLVLNEKKHIALITDIERDAQGTVRAISVSESTQPFIRTVRFTPDSFRGYWLNKGYLVYRYDGVHGVSYTPDPFAPVEGDPERPAPVVNRSLLPDLGNRANYPLGTPVELSVLEDGWDAVEVTAPDGSTETLPLRDGLAVCRPALTGPYSAVCVKGKKKSAAAEWRVTNLIIRAEKETYAFGEAVTLQIEDPEKEPIVAWQYLRRSDEKGAGSGWLSLQGETSVTIPGPAAAGGVELYLIARGPYGDHASRRIPLEIAEP